ncbi:MAG: hypothetical protein ACI8P3_001041 [Saprospiraceae bacterium]|jgi:hypothetical protein
MGEINDYGFAGKPYLRPEKCWTYRCPANFFSTRKTIEFFYLKNPKMKISTLLIPFVLLLSAGCYTFNSINLNDKKAAKLYQRSIEDAIYPEAKKVDTNLVPLDKQNKNLVWKSINGEDYILVVTWKQNVSYYQKYLDSLFYNTGPYPVWITAAPELLHKMKKVKRKYEVQRLKQLLGLPPNAVYSYFVEFWVKPEDLFRPCPDKDVLDKKCDLYFPDQTDSTHIDWINENRISRYYQHELFDQYPWTQLGYTYDWNPKNKSHVGLSEFVIGADKNIAVAAIYTTSEYLDKVRGKD